MTARQIDLLNIGLLLISALLAYQFPLELFIFSFAILGPLHYLTEINWLDKKSYFTFKNKNVWLSIGIVSSLLIVIPKLYFAFFIMESSLLNDVFLFINKWSNSAIFVSIILAIGFLFVHKWVGWIILIVIALIGSFVLNNIESYAVIVGMLVPTIIHVYIFTLLFMLYGASKTKSTFGYLSVLIAVLLPIAFIYVKIDQSEYLFSDVLKSNYLDNGLHVAPVTFAKFIGISEGKTFFFYETMELRLMMFMSFIYIYHYLNWFSKTTTIAWHKNLTLKRSLVIGILWITMVSLFFYNFRIGFLVALFFSFLHVILEFPLNMISIKNLFSRSRD